MKVFVMAALAALMLGACSLQPGVVADPSMASCNVTRDGKSISVNSGYSCGDPSKVTNGSSATGANGTL